MGWKLPATMVIAAIGIALSLLAPVIDILGRVAVR